jgi:hypothetical protein
VAGDRASIKQHSNRMILDQRQRLKKEVQSMLEHKIAEASISLWSSPCLLVDKSDKSDGFYTFLLKVNDVPKPLLEDCVSCLGNGNFGPSWIL